MKYLKLPRLRHHDRPLQYVPDRGPHVPCSVDAERSVPRPAHLSAR